MFLPALAFALLPEASAATLAVGPTRSLSTISDAVAVAADGDILTLDPGTYEEAVVLVGRTLTFSALGAVTWRGTDTELLRVEGGTVVVLGVTFAADGARAITATQGASVRVVNSRIAGNDRVNATWEGAAAAALDGAALAFDNCDFENNLAYGLSLGGHLYADGATLEVEDATFTSGGATVGGAIACTGAAICSVTRADFVTHGAALDGGVFFLDQDATLTATSVTITDAAAGRDGGGLFADAAGAVILSEVTVRDARAVEVGGAARLNNVVDAQLEGLHLRATSARKAGGLALDGVGLVQGSDWTVCDSEAGGEGGALRVTGAGATTLDHLVLLDTRTTGARANGEGGAIWIDAPSGSVALDHADLLDGSATGAGGSVRIARGQLTATHVLWGWTNAGSAVAAATGTTVALDWSAWWSNASGDVVGTTRGTHAVQADPLLFAYRRNGVCDDDDLRLVPTSPLRDGGDPSTTDPDGSIADIGATGGLGARPDLWIDGDSDGTVFAYDCDDGSSAVRPGANEICNGVDDDCDGDIDVNAVIGAPTWYRDRDRDGFGADSSAVTACDPPGNTVPAAGDCDDNNDGVFPGAEEVCNDLDDNCDGSTDGADARGRLQWYRDNDDDGHGDPGASIGACDKPEGYVLSDRDCDDRDPLVSPDGTETCDGRDEDCDEVVDDDAQGATPWYPDADGDGWGADAAEAILSCSQPAGAVRDAGDCDDADATYSPRATESCADGVDRNCDGLTGDVDHDGDGFVACADCDDADADVFPGAPDTPYDGVRTDCDRTSDFDADQDGVEAMAFGGADCDDADANVFPGAIDLAADTGDADCDGDPGEDTSGCACDHGRPSPTPWLLIALVAARRRRTT